MKHNTKLLSKEEVAEGTMAFHFEKPAEFAFKAGQTIDLTLIDPPETDAEGNTRTFSLASAPEESILTIATRMRDTSFKRVLRDAAAGQALQLDGPTGSFTLHDRAERPAIMLVGGIGITPFRSIIKDATERTLPHHITLFYSNRRPEDTAFLKDLQELEKRNPNFRLVATMTEMEKSAQSWDGETGYITKEMLDRHVPSRTDAIYYSAGPETMVGAMRTMLTDAGVSNDDIRTEEFAGY